MPMLLLQTIIVAQNDDTGSLVQILFIIIVFAISIISNIIKSKSTKPSQQKGSHASRGPVRQAPAREQNASRDQTESSPNLQPARDHIEPPSRPPAQQERRVREVPLRPRSLELARKSKVRQYPPGGFGEVLSGKSRLDRFLEAKLQPAKRPARPREREELDVPSKEAEDLDDFARLELERKPKPSKPETTEAVTSLELNADNLADAIVYAEILGKPMALREPSGLE